MNAQDTATTLARHIADYTTVGERAQRAQTRCHEAAMKEQPGTTERNTLDGGVAYNRNRKGRANGARAALIDFARETQLLTEDQIVAAVKRGKDAA